MEHILKAELHLTYVQTSLLFIAPILMSAAVAIPAGHIADRIGIGKAAGIGAIIIAVGTILRGTATNSSSLLAFTFLYGVGLGWSFPNLLKLVSTWVPREKAGMAIGIFTLGTLIGCSLALAITMPVVFPITNTFQGVFFIWGIPSAIAAILWWILVKEFPNNRIPDEPVTRAITPFRQILRSKNLWLVSIFLMLQNFFFYAWTGWAPTLVRLKGATPDLAGLITSMTLWVGIPTVLLMPRLAYKLGLRKPFLWATSIALALAAWGAIHISLPMSWPLMILIGVASTTAYVTILALPIEMMPREDVGTASGLMLSIGYIGGAIGALISGRILDLTRSLNLSLLVLAGVAIAAAGIAVRLPETGPKARPQPPSGLSAHLP
jgi:CP family cyanate transporter-like MFS transporter